jgi:hypothetical protein
LASSSKRAKHSGFSNWEAKVDRSEIENRIWGQTIKNARARGIISDKEAEFLIQKYLEEFRDKNGWDGKAYIPPKIF